MNSLRSAVSFFIIFLVSGLVSYFLHLFVVENPSQDVIDYIQFSYYFSFGLGLIFTLPILLLKKHIPHQLGYIFLASSFVKLIILMILVKFDQFVLDKSELLHFFVPYAISLGIEIFFISRELKKIN